MNVLFVCSGNTCRSPMARALMDAIARKNGLDIAADSAGLFAYDGAPISNGSAQVLREDYQLNLMDHRAKSLDEALVDWADRIVCMTKAHEGLVRQEFPRANACTLGGWAKQEMDIRDPHGGKIEDYRYCAQQIQELLDKVISNYNDIT